MALTVEIYRLLAWTPITQDIPFLGDPIPGLIPFELEVTRESNVAVLRFAVNASSYSNEALGTEIRVRVDGTQIFGGYLTTRERIRMGTMVGANYECQDYNSILDRIVVTGYTIDAGDTDSTEIETLRASKLAGIGVTAGTISTVQASMPELYLQGTFRQAMEAIAAAAGGAYFHIDQNKQLNYVGTTGTYALVGPEVLNDDLTVANAYPYADFVEREDETRKIDRVFILGDGIDGWYPAADSGEVYQAIVYDETVTTQDALDALGAAIVDDWGDPIKEYSLRCWEDAFWSDPRISVTHSDFISGGDTLYVRRVILRARSSDCEEREYILEMGDHTTESDSFGPAPGTGGGGGLKEHNLLSDPYHIGTANSAPSRGDLIVADSSDLWNSLAHPAAAGYAIVTDATDTAFDRTPTWTGAHTWDDGSGDSPAIHFVTESNDQFSMWAENNATPGDSDFVFRFPAANADTQFIWRDSGATDVAFLDADGKLGLGITPSYMLHVSGPGNPTAYVGNPSGSGSLQINAGGTGNNAQFYLATDDQEWRIGNRGDASDAFVIRDHTNTADMLTIAPSTGDVDVTTGDVILPASHGLIHDTANNAGYVWRCDGTRAYPAAIQSTDVPGLTAQFVTMAASGDLANERVLTAGDGLDLTDGGAGGNATLAVDVTDILGSGLTESANNIDISWGASASTIQCDDVASGGASTNASRSDHEHAIACAAPTTNLSVSSTNAEGAAYTFARSDHTHEIDSSANPGAAASLLASNASGDLTLQDLTLAEYLNHGGDADTYIRFQADNITLRAGGVDLLNIVEAGTDYVVINDTTLDGNQSGNVFEVHGGHVGVEGVNGEPAVVQVFAYGSAATDDMAIFRGRRARGTQASPSAAQSGDALGRIGAGGYGASQYPSQSTGYIQFLAAENFTDANNGTHVQIASTPTGSVTPAEIVRVAASGRVKIGGNFGTIDAQTHILQDSATGAIPVLKLKQDDADYPFISVQGTAAAADLTRCIVDYGDEGSSTAAVWLKVGVTDDGNQVADQAYHVLGYILA